jgi:hypothetical protein
VDEKCVRCIANSANTSKWPSNAQTYEFTLQVELGIKNVFKFCKYIHKYANRQINVLLQIAMGFLTLYFTKLSITSLKFIRFKLSFSKK